MPDCRDEKVPDSKSDRDNACYRRKNTNKHCLPRNREIRGAACYAPVEDRVVIRL